MAEYTRQLKKNVDEELQKIADKGLNNSNFENAYKLVIMREKLCRTEQLEMEMGMGDEHSMRGYSMDGYSGDGRYTMQGEYSRDGGYSNLGEHSMDGYSGARNSQHYVRGHYSRAGNGMSGNYSGDYSGTGRMENCKAEMMEALAMMERTATPKDKQKIAEYKRMIGSMEV